ncbi:TPA: hypothetical protein ACYLN4_000584 [Burkholderia lata]
MSITLKTIRGSGKSSHQQVMDSDAVLGSVWREQVDFAVSKLTEPRRMAKRWRWFSQGEKGGVHGRGTRAALIFGPGYRSRNEAVDALVKAQAGVAA